MKQKYFKLTVVVFIAHLLFQLVTLKDYGMNWDEPAHYLRGQAYLHYFLTGKEDYLDLRGQHAVSRRSIYQYDDEGIKGKFTYTWYLKNDMGHPPLNGIFASFFNFVFYQKLGITGDIESYHLFTILISSILAGTIFWFTSAYFGLFSGIISLLSLILFPLFFSETHFNVKDPVEAAFYAFTIVAFYLGITKKSIKWLLSCGIFAGLSLSTKFNIFFSMFTLAAWFLTYYWSGLKSFKWPLSKTYTSILVILPAIALFILFICWPYLWTDPLQHFNSIVNFYKSIGAISYQAGNPIIKKGLNTYALQWILYTTPLVILFFSSLGIFKTMSSGLKEKDKTSLLVFFWFLVPVLRVTVPNAGIYGGVRQIMEFIPPLAILSGIGAAYLKDIIVKRFTKVNHSFITILFILSFVPITAKLISIHPNENVYFNPLIGGLKGAKEKNFPDWGTTLGSVYQQGTDWLNSNAEKGADAALIKGLLANIPRTKLRGDINFHPVPKGYSGNKKSGEYLIEVTDYRWVEDIPKAKRDYLETLNPVYEVKVDNVAILTIWKNDFAHTKNY